MQIWKGPNSVIEALEQLCDRYLTWADTRCAIILFGDDDFGKASTITTKALKRLRTKYKCTEQGHIAAWPVVRIEDPPGRDTSITVAVVVI